MMRYIIANWKMNMGLADITKWVNEFKKALPSIPENKTVIVAPSFPYLGLMAELAKDGGFELASQDVSSYEKGAHTGEVGAFQIKDLCKYAIVGHSELGKTFEEAIVKRDLCLAEGVNPIFCFVKATDAKKAYLPGVLAVWEDPSNISKEGVNNPKPISEIVAGVEAIRKQIPATSSLIYGGSVNRQNIEELSKIKGLDGVLVGSASNDAVHFAELVVKF